jgi:hypothetical protein
MSRYKLAVQGLEGSQAISGLLHQCIANELFRTYLGVPPVLVLPQHPRQQRFNPGLRDFQPLINLHVLAVKDALLLVNLPLVCSNRDQVPADLVIFLRLHCLLDNSYRHLDPF